MENGKIIASFSDDSKLRALHKQINELEKQSHAAQLKLNSVSLLKKGFREEIARLREEIYKLQNPKEPKVSEHALLRYFERVLGFDLNEIKDEILTSQVVNQIKTLGNGTYVLGTEHKMIVRDNVVTTIIGATDKVKRGKKHTKFPNQPDYGDDYSEEWDEGSEEES